MVDANNLKGKAEEVKNKATDAYNKLDDKQKEDLKNKGKGLLDSSRASSARSKKPYFHHSSNHPQRVASPATPGWLLLYAETLRGAGDGYAPENKPPGGTHPCGVVTVLSRLRTPPLSWNQADHPLSPRSP